MSLNKAGLVKSSLEKEKEELLKTIKNTASARNESPAAFESHSDTSRIQADKMLTELNLKLKVLNDLMFNIPEDFPSELEKISVWSYSEIITINNRLKIILVPEGYGGRTFEDIKFISDSTPLGKTILNKKNGDSFIFNEKEYKIQKIL